MAFSSFVIKFVDLPHIVKL